MTFNHTDDCGIKTRGGRCDCGEWDVPWDDLPAKRAHEMTDEEWRQHEGGGSLTRPWGDHRAVQEFNGDTAAMCAANPAGPVGGKAATAT